MKKLNLDPKADAVIVHTLPGRMRLRLPEKKQDIKYFEQLLATMSAVSGVSRLAMNPRTGSVYIHYEQGDALHQFLEGNDFFSIRENPAGQEDSIGKDEQRRAVKFFAQSAGMAKFDIPPAKLAALGMVGWSCYKLLQGKWTTPEWYVTLWYAYSLYRESEKKMGVVTEARS